MKKNKLILGTVQFGVKYGINNEKGKPSFKKVKDILDFAYLKGIRLLDTAEAYGDSQKRIGQYHKINPNKFNIITKFSPLRKDLSENIMERVNDNLKTLDVKYLYSYMFHSFGDYKKYFSEFKHDLIELRNSHKIKKIGVSLNSNEEIMEVLRDSDIELIQLPFNMLDNSTRRKNILTEAKSKGVEVHTRSVFLQGLFFKNENDLVGNVSLLKEGITQIKNIVSKERDINKLALQYVINKPYIDCVLLGVDSVDQLEKNLSCINKALPNKIEQYIDNINISEISMLNPANW